jgi:hypothetical protein
MSITPTSLAGQRYSPMSHKKPESSHLATCAHYSLKIDFKAAKKFEWLASVFIHPIGHGLRSGQRFSCEHTRRIYVSLSIMKDGDSQAYDLGFSKIVNIGERINDNIQIEVDETDPKSSRIINL